VSEGAPATPLEPPRRRPVLLDGLVAFEALLYGAVALLLAAAAALVLAGTVDELARGISRGQGAVDIAVGVLDRILELGLLGFLALALALAVPLVRSRRTGADT
jgi:hypothetical protein